MNRDKELPIIGSTEYVEIFGIKKIPAKIDTGADSSSIWASHIKVTKDGVLRFQLFDKNSPFYTGKTLERTNFKVAVVRNAFGHEQIRYRIYLTIKIGERKIKALFYLADRSRNRFPVLVGRRTISRKFLVDVSNNKTKIPTRHPESIKRTQKIQYEFKNNPHEFHQKYIKNTSDDTGNI